MQALLNLRRLRRTMLGGVFVAALVVGGVAPPALADSILVPTPVGANVTVSAALGSVTMSATFSSIAVGGDTQFETVAVADAYPGGIGIAGAGELIYSLGTTFALDTPSTITTCLEFDPAEIGNVAVALFEYNSVSDMWVDGGTIYPSSASACIVQNDSDVEFGEFLPVFTPVPIVPQPLPIVTDDYELSVEPGIGPINIEGEILIEGDFPILNIRISNVSSSPIQIGLGIDMLAEGVSERLWLDDTWGGAEGIGSFFARSIQPGAQLAWDVPDWPGRDYSFYLLGSGDQSDLGQLLGSYQTTGRFVSFDFSSIAVDGTFSLGSEAFVSGSGVTPEVFPGVTATVTSLGLTPGDELELWLAPNLDYFYFYFLGAVLPADAVNVGSGVVGSDGSLSATFDVPASTPLGSYQLMVGDPADRFWPAGTYSSFYVTLPSSSNSAAFDGNLPVTVDLGATDVTFTGQSGAGTVTASVSTTGPILNGFLFASSPQLYYHLSSTVAPSAPVLVCITYDPLTLPGEAPYLYHYVAVPGGYKWQNITTTRTEGYVCGTTTSFSPFTLGYPVEGQPLNKEGCKDGGWEISELPVFSNQGNCVSYFVAAVKK